MTNKEEGTEEHLICDCPALKGRGQLEDGAA